MGHLMFSLYTSKPIFHGLPFSLEDRCLIVVLANVNFYDIYQDTDLFYSFLVQVWKIMYHFLMLNI